MSALLDDMRPRPGPFDLDHDLAYRGWRAAKRAGYPLHLADLTVDVADPTRLTRAERDALLRRVARANMAVYRSGTPAAGRDVARAVGAQLGLQRLHANWLADEDGVSSITVGAAGETRGEFIPYTTRAMGWHTDGYYHPGAQRIGAIVLHCARPARAGGANALVDHELLYMALRDADPALVRALTAPDAMTIPPREDERGVARPAEVGPVFSVDADGALHMRYTARTRSIRWKDDAATRAAIHFVERWLASEHAGIFRLVLAAGMGIVANNVLHDRSAFENDPVAPRLLYRTRWLDRIRAGDVDRIARAESLWRSG